MRKIAVVVLIAFSGCTKWPKTIYFTVGGGIFGSDFDNDITVQGDIYATFLEGHAANSSTVRVEGLCSQALFLNLRSSTIHYTYQLDDVSACERVFEMDGAPDVFDISFITLEVTTGRNVQTLLTMAADDPDFAFDMSGSSYSY